MAIRATDRVMDILGFTVSSPSMPSMMSSDRRAKALFLPNPGAEIKS